MPLAAPRNPTATRAYLFLRRVENRIQMVGDQQTHIIPAERSELDRIARLSGFEDTDEFGNALLEQFKLVETLYGALFEKMPEPSTPVAGIVVVDEGNPETLASLLAVETTQVEFALGRYVADRCFGSLGLARTCDRLAGKGLDAKHQRQGRASELALHGTGRAVPRNRA